MLRSGEMVMAEDGYNVQIIPAASYGETTTSTGMMESNLYKFLVRVDLYSWHGG